MKTRGDSQYDLLPEVVDEPNNLSEEKAQSPKPIFVYPKEHILTIPFIWDGYDTFFTMVFIFFGLFSRFWIIHQPQTYTQFEVKYLTSIHYYLNKTFFVSDQPPFQELLMGSFARKMEYESIFNINPDQNYTFHMPFYTNLRSISAFYSMMSIPILYLTLRCFGSKQFCSFCGGFFCLISQTMIPTMRNIDISGAILFYTSASLLFAGLSHHFIYGSPQQILFVFLQGLFASFSISSSFLTFPIVIFSMFWPLVRFNSKKQALINGLLSILCLYLSCLLHFLYTPIIQGYQASKFGVSNFSQFHSSNNNYKSLEFRHLVYSYYYMNLLIFRFIKQSLCNLHFSSVFRKLLMLENWHVIWSQNGRLITCFTNKLVTFPAALFAYYGLLSSFRNLKFDSRKCLSLLFVLFLLWNAFSYHPSNSGCYDSYLPEYFGIIIFILYIENSFTPKDYGIVLTFLLIVCGLLFLDWVPVIYAYVNPNPFVQPGINIADYK